MHRKPKRFLTQNGFDAALVHAPPLELAKRAVEDYRELTAAHPSWDWPIVCLRFAQEAVELVESPHLQVGAVLEACQRFEVESKGVKGVIDVQFLHDWLMNQVESSTAGDA
jgi:hypothetical protein